MSCKRVETNLEVGVLNNSEWIENWKDGDIGFHQPVHDRFLDENEEKMFEGKKKSIFAPLCGKALDLFWMYERGHTVCGVEIAEQAIQEFFSDHNLPVEVTDVPNVGKLYKSPDGRLKFYVADLFDVNVGLCGQFDVIFDHRSLVAINLQDHQLYKNLLLSLMKPDSLYYLSTIEFDPEIWPGPPHSTEDKLVRNLYDDKCNIELLEESSPPKRDVPPIGETSGPDAKPPNLARFEEAIKYSSTLIFRWYLLKLK